MEGTPSGDAPPPCRQRATPARKGARGGTGAGSPRPHRSHPEHTGRGTTAAHPRGRAVGVGTAPNTRRPTQQWQATPPPGDGPPPLRGTQPPQGVQAKPGREEPGPDRPPQSTPEGARDRGRTRGGARTTWNGATSAQCQDRARCPRHTTQGGGVRTPRERERTHTQRARRDYQKGNRTELAERTDRVEWRISEQG